MRQVRPAAALLGLAICIAPVAALSQPPAQPLKRTPQQVVDSQLAAAPKLIGDVAGYYGEFGGALAKGATARHKVTTTPDEDAGIQVVGACDEGCGLLDLKLLDEKGAEVATVIVPDAYPLVYSDVDPKTVYQVEVTMADCKTATCLYGIRIWRKARRKDD
jgi:hypothetical protein